jgi:heme/copper-type cytochrome/quinol oxidase subunit 3
MSHTEIYLIVGTITFASTFGVYAVVRIIRQHMTPPVNRLHRRGDIELNYIEPTQPAHAYHPIDLVNLNYEPYN